MANVKISALPIYTGSPADLRWFVMNNSGETTTYKFSGYTSPFKLVGTNGRITNVLDAPSNITGDYSMILGGSGNTITAGNKNAILYGENATNAGSAGCIIAAQGGSITDGFGNGVFGGINTCGGNYSATIGGISNIIGGTFNDRDVIAGGQNNIFYNASNSFIGGGSENDVYGASVAVIAGYNNTLSTGNLTFVAGTQDNTITQPGYTYALIGGGYNTINNQNNSAGNAMYSSYFCNDTTSNSGGASINTFFGAYTSTITGWGKLNNITNSYSSTITNNPSSDVLEWFNKIDSSSGSSITFSKQSQILGGVDNIISGKTRSIMIGTSGRTASADNTTYVENIHSYRTPSTQVQSVVSGTTFTCNLDNGAKSQFYITGTSTINITNVRDGASFMIKTQTDGNYVMTWTATGGYTFLFENGLKDPGNTTIDIFKFEVFGNVIYGSRAHNFA